MKNFSSSLIHSFQLFLWQPCQPRIFPVHCERPRASLFRVSSSGCLPHPSRHQGVLGGLLSEAALVTQFPREAQALVPSQMNPLPPWKPPHPLSHGATPLTQMGTWWCVSASPRLRTIPKPHPANLWSHQHWVRLHPGLPSSLVWSETWGMEVTLGFGVPQTEVQIPAPLRWMTLAS